jgi:peptide/nickel transport system permease protein
MLWAVPTLLVITFLVYVAIRLGSNPVYAFTKANARATKAQLDQFKNINGLYSGPSGYVRGYFKWLWGFVRGPSHWAKSISGKQDVYPLLKHALANTLVLGTLASLVGITVGNTLGVLAARRPGKARDTTVNTAALIGLSVPPFVSAIVLQMLFAVYWQKWFGKSLFPTSGIYPAGHTGFDLVLRAKYLVLPVFCVAIQTMAVYARYMRASLLEVLGSEYMRTARSKGISETRVLVRHALRNALIPVTTLAFLELGALVGGLIITERLFQYPGMGDYFLTAYGDGDFPKMMPWLVVIVLSVILFNLIADILYASLDPRIRLD